MSEKQDSPVQSPSLKLNEIVANRTILVGGASILGIFLLFAVVTLLSAIGLGKNFFFSKLANYLPVEQAPLLSSLRKSNQALVQDALKNQVSLNNAKNFKGIEVESFFQSEVQGEQISSLVPFAGTASVSAFIATAADGETTKGSLTYGGEASSGVFSFNQGKEGVKIDFLAPNRDELYLKLHLSPELKSTIRTFAGLEVEEISPLLKETDKYFLFQYPEYRSMTDEMTKKWRQLYAGKLDDHQVISIKLDPNRIRESYANMVNELQPDFQQYLYMVVEKSLQGSKITLLPRQKVHGQSTVVFQVEVDEEQLKNISFELQEEFWKMIKKHQAVIEKYCESVTPLDIYNPDCSEQFGLMEDTFIDLNDTQKATIKKYITESFSYFDIKNFMVYVDPSNNALVKAELQIEANVDALSEKIKAMDYRVSLLRFTLRYQELSRGKDFTIEVPTETLNFTEESRKTMENQFNETRENFRKYPPRF